MDTVSQVTKLMSLVLSSGETPEAVCRDCPELLEKVRQKLAAHQRVEEEIRLWFPHRCSAGNYRRALAPRRSIRPARHHA